MKFYTNPADQKWAVLYGSWCGSTRDASAWISEGMGRIAAVVDVKEKPDVSAYDHIVIGSAIRAWKSTPEMQAFLQENKDLLKEKVRGFFAVCGNYGRPVGPEQVKQFIDDHMAELCGVTGAKTQVFNGRITKSLWEPELVAGLKKQAASPENLTPEGKPKPTLLDMPDYDKLKREECMAFGKEIFGSAG